MRTVISLILLAGLVNKSLAQEPKPGDYIPYPQHKKFEGTWKAMDIKNDLKIKFVNNKKVPIYGVDIYIDQLEGFVTYIKNGDTILKNANIINGGVSNLTNIYAFSAIFVDPKERHGNVYGNFQNEKDLDRLTITIIPRPNNGFMNDNRPLRLPEKLILKRIE